VLVAAAALVERRPPAPAGHRGRRQHPAPAHRGRPAAGLDPETERTDHEELLRDGATVLLYTDGLVERREDASIDDGLERLLAAAGELAGAPLSELCDRLLDLLGTTGNDDIALLALRAYPEDLPRPPEAGPRIVPGDHAGSTD
jgi:hypothetical protein